MSADSSTPNNDNEDSSANIKREIGFAGEDSESPNKKAKTESDDSAGKEGGDKEGDAQAFVPAGTVGVTTINDNDVLSGRGGGTNLHPGNRQFRDLINLYRRDYLKARKNDKPAISRSIVNAIREKDGRFLKKVEKTGLWFEIGDDAAREKTSQALRQRAPEMRKLLLDHEMEGARAQQQQMMMGMPPGMPPIMMPGMNMPMMMPNGNMAFNPAMMGMPNGMFNPAMMGMPPMGFNGVPPQGNPQQVGAMPGMPPGPNNPAGNGDANGENGGAPVAAGGAPFNGAADGSNTNPPPPANNIAHDVNAHGGAPDNNNNNNGMPPMAVNPMHPAVMGMNPAAMGQIPNMGAPGPESPSAAATTI